MASLRALADCLGLPKKFSVVHDFFGYASGPPWNLAGSQTPLGVNNLGAAGTVNLPQRLSLLTQMKRIQQPYFNLNAIRVGTDIISESFVNPGDEQNVDCAVQLAREIFAARGIGIGRFERGWHVPLQWLTGYEVIDDDCVAEDLVDQYTVPNDGIDAFFVLLYDDSDTKGDQVGVHPDGGDGIVVESRRKTFVGTGRTLAHELGHFFGLDHSAEPCNLMAQSTLAVAACTQVWSTVLKPGQVGLVILNSHTKPAC
jgi:hypothetical protein